MQEDIKVIYANAQRYKVPDDPSFPWKLHVVLRPPEFMQVAFMMMCGGTEEIIVRGKTKESLEEFLNTHHLNANHPRFIRMTLNQPELVEN